MLGYKELATVYNTVLASRLHLLSEEMLDDALCCLPDDQKEMWRDKWREINIWTGTGTNKPRGIFGTYSTKPMRPEVKG